MRLTKENIFTIVAVLFILAAVILRFTGVSGGTPDFSVVSSTDSGHSHIAVISGSDIDRPPREKVITTSEDGATPHTHIIGLTESDYRAISAGTEITIVSVPFPDDSHTHTFAVRMPASSG